jgi:MoaA/NifB/PqqE/SkfB family radical SAM enzyme
MNLAWDHWHIEASSKCALRCPRCPRAELSESLLNQQLSLSFFQNQIGQETIAQIKKITFCGNDGDPIYCTEFLEICSWIKEVNPDIQLVIITNGSYKGRRFWKNLAEILNQHDEVHFSIDGLGSDNQKYRIGSDWNSVCQAIDTFRRHNQTTFLVWASIAFSFNQTYLDAMQQQAIQWGFDLFQLTKSTKFGSKYPSTYGNIDPLEPTDPELISSSHRYERALTALSDKARPGQELKKVFFQRAENLKNSEYSGICMIGNKGVFLNSQGEFYPCCWTANRYEHNKNWQGKFNLNHRSFQDILSDAFWSTDFLKFNSLECQTKCTKERLLDYEHTTEW